MNNEEKNTYAKNQITNATMHLLESYELTDISISQITAIANVSRNSFYRNYSDKEEILLQYVRLMLTTWKKEYDSQKKDSASDMYGSLFEHLYQNKELYLLLKKRNLFHLVLTVLLELSGPRPELENMWAYTTAFITYGTFGWIEEWINRGMQESAETMATLLSSHRMK